MFDIDNWHEIWAVLRANPLRTLLTAFGVVWAIFMLMFMLAFGSGLQVGAKNAMRGMADNTLFVWGQSTTKPYQGLPTGRVIHFDTRDMDALRGLPDVEYIAPVIQAGGFGNGSTAVYGTKSGSFNIYGEQPDFAHIVSLEYTAGRFINKADVDEHRKVAVIGNKVVEQLYTTGENPIGTYLKLNGVFFKVVGTFKPIRGGNWGDRDAQSIYCNFSAFQQVFHTGDKIGFITLTARPGSGERIERVVKQTLARTHRFDPTDELAIGSFNAFKASEDMNAFFVVLKVVVWVVGFLTLLAGTIGVSNIMLITVKERTREIGLRKALGASPVTIIAMIMKESMVLTAIAGLLGIAAGAGIIAAFDAAVNMMGPTAPFGHPAVGLGIAVQALVVLILSGAIAGIMPAAHAASIQPVEALRAE
ncbi:MAG TPA: ABC transporter permease [Kofleriaceae bacterium]|nr:ABC transporter permease [Kofleriaceae bacterium]